MQTYTSASSQPNTVYYHQYRWLFFLLGFVSIIFAGYSIYLGSLILVLLFLFLALWMLALAQILRIVISPAGIAYHNMGFYTIESSWQNVDRIMAVSTSFGTIRCLTLHLPVVHGWTGLAWLLQPSERGRAIPISHGWARREQLDQHIRQYAPQIAE